MSESNKAVKWNQPLTKGPGMRPAARGHSSGTPRRRERSSSRYVTKREMKGGKMNVPTNPPSINHQPWFQTTIVHSGQSGDITMTVKDIITQLVEQLDPHRHGFAEDHSNQGHGAILNIRLRSVRAWNISGRMIALSVDDFSDADKAIADVDALCGIVDTGSSAHIPAVGYELPESHRNIVLRNGTDRTTDTSAVLYHIVSSSNDSVIIYTNIYWKFDGPAKFSAFHNQMLASVQQIERSAFLIEDNLSTIREKSEEGGHGHIVIDGIKKVAPYVIASVIAEDEKDRMRQRIEDLESRIKQLSFNATMIDAAGSPRIRSRSEVEFGTSSEFGSPYSVIGSP